MNIDYLLARGDNDKDALLWNNKFYSYSFLKKNIAKWSDYLRSNEIAKNSVVGLSGDFSPNTISLFFSLIKLNCIIVPFDRKQKNNNKQKYEIAKIEYLITIDKNEKIKISKIKTTGIHTLYNSLIKNNIPGLVMFTSGTSGIPKAAVHDLAKLLEKFRYERKALRTLNFLLFDHWGGLNTMFHVLSNGGVVITTNDRNPESVCRLVEKCKIELLPTSPTFLNLMLLSGAHKKYNLSSLKIISYGTEPMPENILLKLKMIFPKVKLQQTYGLIELGVLRSKSEKNDSLWVKIGGEGYKTRIVDNILQIKAESAMLGYLNARSPFTDDGWFITGDEVLQKGEYIKILGRKSEIINVGGEKVYPQEVENVIQNMPNVIEVLVYKEKNQIMGSIVCAKVRLVNDENPREFSKKVKMYCKENLEKYKVPVKIKITTEKLFSERLKKSRVKPNN